MRHIVFMGRIKIQSHLTNTINKSKIPTIMAKFSPFSFMNILCIQTFIPNSAKASQASNRELQNNIQLHLKRLMKNRNCLSSLRKMRQYRWRSLSRPALAVTLHMTRIFAKNILVVVAYKNIRQNSETNQIFSRIAYWWEPWYDITPKEFIAIM